MHLSLKNISLLLIIFLSSCSSESERKLSDESLEENKRVIGNIYKMFETGDVSQIDKYVERDMNEHTPDPLIIPTGIEGLKELIRVNHIAFPDLKIKVYNITAEGDLVYAHFNWAATNTGPIREIEPTLRSIDIDGVDIIRIKDGKISEHWGYWDAIKFLNQLGQPTD